MTIDETEKFYLLLDIRIAIRQITGLALMNQELTLTSANAVRGLERVQAFIDSIPTKYITAEEEARLNQFTETHLENEDYSWMGEVDEQPED